MKFLDLRAQYKSIQKEIDHAINDVINSSSFIMGRHVSRLEEKIAEYIGVKYAVGLNSGSDALMASLIALNIGEHDEVIIPSFTYIATAEAVATVGARTIFVDVDKDTYNINPTEIKNAITKKTKAIIPVHLYGQPADMDEIMKIAKKHNLYVIEDAAQAIGAEWNGKKVGSFGDTGCLSFFPTKNLGAYGDGGMVVTNNKRVAKYLRHWRIHGQSKKYYSDFIGVSSRLDALQAAILLAKLPHLDTWNNQRRLVAEHYYEAFSRIKLLKIPRAPSQATSVFHQYTIQTKYRDEIKKILLKRDIPSMIYYPIPLHRQAAYLNNSVSVSVPNTETLCQTVLSLPIYPELPDSDQQLIIRELQLALDRCQSS